MRTLVIFKPDAVENGLWLIVLGMLRAADFKIKDLYMEKMHLDTIAEFYPHGIGQPWMEENVEFLRSGPSVMVMIEGDDAIASCRKLALEIRDLHGTKNPRNLMHASDSAESAVRELAIWFWPGAHDDCSSE